MLTSFPENIALPSIHTRLGDFHDEGSTGFDDLGRTVNDLSSNRGGITGDWKDVLQDIFFEGFKQKEGDHRAILKCDVETEAFEGKLFKANVFQPAMSPFILPTLMITTDG